MSWRGRRECRRRGGGVHQIEVMDVSALIPQRALVRCWCGHKLTPRLVPMTDLAEETRRRYPDMFGHAPGCDCQHMRTAAPEGGKAGEAL